MTFLILTLGLFETSKCRVRIGHKITKFQGCLTLHKLSSRGR
jgi:hypothetical protein